MRSLCFSAKPHTKIYRELWYDLNPVWLEPSKLTNHGEAPPFDEAPSPQGPQVGDEAPPQWGFPYGTSVIS